MTHTMDETTASRLALALTAHARGRMLERGVGAAEVAAALQDVAHLLRGAAGIAVTGTNGVTIVCDQAATVVITVLPRSTTPARWRGPHEGVGGYRRDITARRNRSRNRAYPWSGSQVAR